jgi:CCR4-NOT transcription complex subunit 4
MSDPVNQSKKIPQLKDTRIVKKDLVYLIGLTEEVANETLLAKAEYFGQYGNIRKIVVNKDKPFNRGTGEAPSFSAYVTFSHVNDASIAILGLDEFNLNDRLIKASYGMTKYCSYFIKGISCQNNECLYLHTPANEDDCYSKVILKGREPV